MGFIPLARMWERVEVGRRDSDTTLFHDLMYLGEMTAKVITAAMVASIQDDKDRSRYRQIYQLVRADGVGKWADVLVSVINHLPADLLLSEARIEQRELNQKCGPESWQYRAVEQIHGCLSLVCPDTPPLLTKAYGFDWIKDFASFRNKTRGHGAPKCDLIGKICPMLEESIRHIVNNCSLFRREWAYIHRNLSGKYRVSPLSDVVSCFEPIKRSCNDFYPDGVYVGFDRPVRVEVAESDVDVSDFFLANGGFRNNSFEMLSYISGSVLSIDSSSYMFPPTDLPQSETTGCGGLDGVGKVLSNLPPRASGYVQRPGLEKELFTVLSDEQHSPIVTLVGRGGVGKTSLALAAIYDITSSDRFSTILWFSARDLDLLPEGPKLVKPAVLNISDVSKEFARLVAAPRDIARKDFDAQQYLAECMGGQSLGPTLYIFDNFETITNPVECFRWIYEYVRLPNKVLITTRHRDFKADYPINVGGMSEPECRKLIDSVASRLGIRELLTPDYCTSLIDESNGHPYVIKILLGEVAKAGSLRNVERIMADADGILNALFERTFVGLSPTAQRVFFTLCNWRSTVPRLAVEAVLMRAQNERMDVSDAIDELDKSSFVEQIESQEDKELFITTPLAAALFGRKRLKTSPMRSSVEADAEILLQFGACQQSDVRHGVAPRIIRLISSVANRISREPAVMDEYRPMLEFIARHNPATWLYLADLFQEIGSPEAIDSAKEYIRRHLEVASVQDAASSWERLALLCRRVGDFTGEVHCWAELSEQPDMPFDEISKAANRMNTALADGGTVLDREEQRIVVGRLAKAMASRAGEADATDCSRLAWLFIKLKDMKKADEYVRLGLSRDATNEHCVRLAVQLGITRC